MIKFGALSLSTLALLSLIAVGTAFAQIASPSPSASTSNNPSVSASPSMSPLLPQGAPSTGRAN